MILAYARVSSRDQAGPNKTSIAEQLAKCKAVAQLRGARNKYDYVEFTDPGVSGSVPLGKRPGGQAMLDSAKKGDCVVAAKMDRIFRNTADALYMEEFLRKMGVDLILCEFGTEPVAGNATAQLIFSVFAGFAQFERARIHERISEGRAAKKAQGGFLGGRTPFGFKVQGAGSKAILIPDEGERENIRRIRQCASSGRGPAAILRALKRERIVARNGKPYSRNAIWRIIGRAESKENHVNG